MRKVQASVILLAVVAVIAFSGGSAWSQPASTQPNGNGGGRGGRGGGMGGMMDPSAMQKAIADRIKESIDASDDDWKVIQPKLEKVLALKIDSGSGAMTLMRSLMGGGRGGRGGGGGGTRGGGPMLNMTIGGVDLSQTDIAKANKELTDLMQNKDAPTDQIKAKLAALHTAHEKARVALDKAEQDLRDILKVNQEAQLVVMGMLD